MDKAKYCANGAIDLASVALLKSAQSFSKAPYSATGLNGLYAPGTTTAAGAEGRAVLAEKGAPDLGHWDLDHMLGGSIDLSSLAVAPARPADAGAADQHGHADAAARTAAAWAPVDDLAMVFADHHHQDIDVFSAHFANHSPHDFG